MMNVDELSASLRDGDALAGSHPDLGLVRRRGLRLRWARRAAGAVAGALAVAGTASAVGVLGGGGPTATDAGFAAGTQDTTLTAYEQRVLEETEGAYASGGTVVVPGPVDPSEPDNLRLKPGALASAPAPLGWHEFSDPGYIMSKAVYPKVLQRRAWTDDRTGMDVVADNGPASIGCVNYPDLEECAPAVLIGNDDIGWFVHHGIGNDDWLVDKPDMQLFISETYTPEGPGSALVGGFIGAAATVEVVLTDGTRLAAEVGSDLSPGDTLFWVHSAAPVDFAHVVAYDDDGEVVASKKVRDCKGGVDCEVR